MLITETPLIYSLILELIINSWNIYLQQPHSSEDIFSQEVQGDWVSLHIQNGLLCIHWNLKQHNNHKQVPLLLRSASSGHYALNPSFPIPKRQVLLFPDVHCLHDMHSPMNTVSTWSPSLNSVTPCPTLSTILQKYTKHSISTEQITPYAMI